MDQILPDSSRADNNYALEVLTQAVLAGNELQKQMLEIPGKMLTELRRTADQLEKVEVAIRRQRAPAHLLQLGIALVSRDNHKGPVRQLQNISRSGL